MKVALSQRFLRMWGTTAIQVAEGESDAFTLLALQAPVAADLRAVVRGLKNVADADTRHMPSLTTSAASSLKWAESPSVSTRMPKTLSCQEIPRKPFADHAVEIGRRVIFQAAGIPIM